MKKYEFIQIGSFHANHCEDYLISAEVGENKLMIAVMDGCTMGTDSHFASTLIGKILKKIAAEFYYKEFIERKEKNIDTILKEIVNALFQQLKIIKNDLQLEKEELLSTLILGIVNLKNRKAEIIAIGDGLICCNGNVKEFEQNDKPDYLGYHLNEDFDSWFEKQEQGLTLKNINDLSIATDGIFSFKKFDDRVYMEKSETDIIDFLLKNREGGENENMLKKKLLKIEREWGLKPSDDLAIVRLIV